MLHVDTLNDILQRKCDIYWPETTREPVYYGDLVVEIESESTLPDYVLRVMSVKLVRIIFMQCAQRSCIDKILKEDNWYYLHLSQRVTVQER